MSMGFGHLSIGTECPDTGSGKDLTSFSGEAALRRRPSVRPGAACPACASPGAACAASRAGAQVKGVIPRPTGWLPGIFPEALARVRGQAGLGGRIAEHDRIVMLSSDRRDESHSVKFPKRLYSGR